MSKALPSLSRFAAATATALLVASGGADAGDAMLAQQQYLDIPGIGRVPFPPPPGGRGVDPSRRSSPPPRLDGERDAEIVPKRENTLDALFALLAGAESVDEARSIAGSIGRLWARSGSETADLLLARAALAASLGDFTLALALFDKITALEPSWPEGFVGRANAKLIVGDADGAGRDFETAVRLEPRRFDALAALGVLQERAGAPERALEAYRRALSLDPQRDEWRKAEERLRLQVEGRDI